MQDIADDEEKYGGKPEWDSYNNSRREALRRLMRITGIIEADIVRVAAWPTLGRYIQGKARNVNSSSTLFEDLHVSSVVRILGLSARLLKELSALKWFRQEHT